MAYVLSTKILKEEIDSTKEDVTDRSNLIDNIREISNTECENSEWKWEIGESWFASLSYRSGKHVITETNSLESFSKGDVIESVNGECFTGCPPQKLAAILNIPPETDFKLKVISHRNLDKIQKIILCRMETNKTSEFVSSELKFCWTKKPWVQLTSNNQTFLTLNDNNEFVFVPSHQNHTKLCFEMTGYEQKDEHQVYPPLVTLRHLKKNKILAVKKDEKTDKLYLYSEKSEEYKDLLKSRQSIFELSNNDSYLESVYARETDPSRHYFLGAETTNGYTRLVFKNEGDVLKFQPYKPCETGHDNDDPRKKRKLSLNCVS